MNTITIIGNLTRDPEVRTTTSGVTVCNFPVAVNRRYKNANGETETDFFNCVAWRQLGELCGKYLSKGKKVAITGTMQQRNYEKDGVKRTAYDVVIEEAEFLTPSGLKRHEEAPTGAFTDVESDDEKLPWEE